MAGEHGDDRHARFALQHRAIGRQRIPAGAGLEFGRRLRRAGHADQSGHADRVGLGWQIVARRLRHDRQSGHDRRLRRRCAAGQRAGFRQHGNAGGGGRRDRAAGPGGELARCCPRLVERRHDQRRRRDAGARGCLYGRAIGRRGGKFGPRRARGHIEQCRRHADARLVRAVEPVAGRHDRRRHDRRPEWVVGDRGERAGAAGRRGLPGHPECGRRRHAAHQGWAVAFRRARRPGGRQRARSARIADDRTRENPARRCRAGCRHRYRARPGALWREHADARGGAVDHPIRPVRDHWPYGRRYRATGRHDHQSRHDHRQRCRRHAHAGWSGLYQCRGDCRRRRRDFSRSMPRAFSIPVRSISTVACCLSPARSVWRNWAR